ncbi:MAG: hypothetical protein Kow0025_23680 [Thermodesulfovibrionales bacterium]
MDKVYIKRLNPYHRVLHLFMALSFLGLVISGMPLRYSYAEWAAPLVRLFGGYHAAGVVHRVCAVVTFGYFAAHIAFVLWFVARRKFRFNFFGPDSMVPRLEDIRDLYGSLQWFLGAGPRPRFDRWAYWEKFDYWAVFWGVGVIGASGLLLWFPGFFSRYLPGWMFNVATIVHSDEALLAAGFIFTIHFFNTHLRPEKFPMDTVIFTGRLSEEETRRDRPLEYERLVAGGALEARRTTPPPPWLSAGGRAVGALLVLAGMAMLALIIIGQFFS